MESRFERGLCLLDVLDVPEVMRCVLLCMLEAVEGRLCLLEVLAMPDVLDAPDVTRGVLLCMFEAVEGGLCLLEVLEVMRYVLGTLYSGRCGGWALFAEGVGRAGVMRAVRFCTLEAVDGMLCLLEGMRCVLHCMLETVEVSNFAGGVGRAGCAGGDALCANLYAGGVEGGLCDWRCCR